MDGDSFADVQKKRRRTLPEWVVATLCIIAAVAGSIVLLVVICGSIFGLFEDGETVFTKNFSGPSWSYIAKIKVVGEIGRNASVYLSSDQAYHHEWTIQTIDTLIEDENNKGIYLWIETPGGTVYESDELYLKLLEYKETTGRPVYTYMSNMAASGGYYVAALSDDIYANRNTWTGSIGVTMGTFLDVSGFLEKHGIKTETITSGRNKAMGSYFEPMTEEQREIFQSLVDESYDRFVAIVAEGRGMTDKQARTLADGRIYTATQALDAGLIDFVMGERDTEEAIKAKFEDGTDFYNCYFSPETSFSLFGSGGFDIWDFLTSRADPKRNAVYEGDVAAVLDMVLELEESGVPPLKYLYTG